MMSPPLDPLSPELASTPVTGALETVKGTGTAIYALVAGLLTGAHLLFYGAGYPGATVTSILYTILVVSLSPILFYTLIRPMGMPEMRFVATHAAIFSATAPWFYAPSLAGPGAMLAVVCILAAILPPWIQQVLLQSRIKSLESSTPGGLVEALGSPQPSIRETARARLLEAGEAAIPALVRGWRRLRPEESRLRRSLLELLTHFSVPPAGEPSPLWLELRAFWQEHLTTSRDLELRRSAVIGLGRMKDVSAIEPLIGLLQGEQQQNEPMTPARDLMADALFEALTGMTGPLFQAAGGTGGAGIKLGREVISSLLRFQLISPGPKRFEALTSVGAPLVAGIAGMIKEAPPAGKRELTRILAAVQALAAVPLLLELSQDPAADVRLHALGGLIEQVPVPGAPTEPGRPGFPEPLKRQIVDALVRQAGAGEPRVRGVALEGLSRIGDPQSLPILLDYLGSPIAPGEDGALRGLIAANLARTKDPLVLDPLLRLLEASDPAVVAGAARGVGRFKDPRVVPKLKPLLEHPDRNVAVSAAVGLAFQGDNAGLPALQQALTGPPVGSRLEVLEALASIPDGSLIPLLEAGIASQSPGWTPRERAWAIQKLIDLRTPEAFQALERLWNQVPADGPVKAMLQGRLEAAGLLTANPPPGDAGASSRGVPGAAAGAASSGGTGAATAPGAPSTSAPTSK